MTSNYNTSNRAVDSHALQWRDNGRDGVSNNQPHVCLLNRLFRRRSKKTSKLCVTGLCEGNSPLTGEFPAQKASNAENISVWWRHHYYMNIMSTWWSRVGLLWLAVYKANLNRSVIFPRFPNCQNLDNKLNLMFMTDMLIWINGWGIFFQQRCTWNLNYP